MLWLYEMRGMQMIYIKLKDLQVYEMEILEILYGMDWVEKVKKKVKIEEESLGKEKEGIILGWVLKGNKVGEEEEEEFEGLVRKD